jgi:predicted SAM-dependent methyltransferase
MKLLNLGCGTRFHNAWTNVDFISSDKNVIAHNLLHGIPFADNSYEVVYHSHVLEHFKKADGRNFIQECFRVLKPGGIVRIAVPDLERIAKEYLKNLELALQGNEKGQHDYEWIKLELYDQVVRNESGGDMAKYLFQQEIPNEDYVFGRIGEEGRNLRNFHLRNREEVKAESEVAVGKKNKQWSKPC